MDNSVKNLEILIFTTLGLLMLFNTTFLIYGIVIDRQESKRLKTIKATKIEYEKAVKAYEEEVKAIEEEKKIAD